MKGWSICLFIILFVWFDSKSQQILSPFNLETLPVDRLHNASTPPLSRIKSVTLIRCEKLPVKTIPASYYNSTTGFFCQKELQLEKAVRFPVKIRLGSVSYTDRMEGKKRAGQIGY
jgi:hypothetical protein